MPVGHVTAMASDAEVALGLCSVPKGQQLSPGAQQELTWWSCRKEPPSLGAWMAGLIFCLIVGFCFLLIFCQ